MFLELVAYLQSRGPTPLVGAIFIMNELWVSLCHPHRIAKVRVDWQDYGTIRDGVPVMHYRKQMPRVAGDELSN